MAFVSVDNNKSLSLFLLGVHIKAGVIFLMQAANRLGMCLLELVPGGGGGGGGGGGYSHKFRIGVCREGS